MRFLFSCSTLGKEAAKLRKLKRYKPTKFMAEGSRYDKEAADAAVTFINCLKHTKGEWYGMPFELIDWQEQIVRDIFGILKPNGYRQFNTAYIEIPKKQGKSELAAAIALYLTCGDFEHGGEVYGCASDRQQASIVFDVAVDMVEQCPALKSRIKPMLSQKRLVYRPLGSFYQVLSAEAYTKHGLNVHGVVFDELHAQPNRDLYDVMLHGSGDARKQPLFFLITTAGTDRNSICWEVHQKAEDILQGRKIDPTFYPVIYSAADTDDWTSEKVWRKVNPSLGITVDIEKLRVACENAKQNPAEENLFRQLRLNQWVKQSVRWMPMDKWDKCAFPVDAEELRGRTCYGGLDLSSTTDITAFVLVFPPLDESDKYQILPFFWIPEENIDQRVRRDHVPYDVWERQGFLYTTEGNVVHYGFIETFIEEYNDQEYVWLSAFAGHSYKFVKRLTKEERKKWGYAGIWEMTTVRANKEHPAMFPVELPWRCIKMHSDKGGIVLEPFSGSGTTIIAAEQTERKCYAMELSPFYCDLAVKRWEEFTGEKAIKLEG
jgi:phage terminase large subunit-like protein